MRWRFARRGIGPAAALITWVSLVPTMGRAATPVVTCLNAWGNHHPTVWCDPTFEGTLSPTDRPLGRGDRGVLFVRGTASPGTQVTVSVTDGVQTVSKSVPAAARSDVGAGIDAGDFNAEMRVTNLGAHRVRDGATPEDENPADLGLSVLTVSAIAQTADASSSPLVTTLTKYAATPGDVYTPQLINSIARSNYGPTWPPSEWCHGPFIAGAWACPLGTGGTPRPCRLTIHPDVDPFLPPQQCNTGEAVVSGLVDDDAFNAPGREETEYAFGKASEIGDIRVAIAQGSRVLKEFSSVDRITGTKAVWSVTLRINDFEPNYPSGDKYRVIVKITDAWGHEVVKTSPAITVYPW
jgi:hypothetical protein